MDKLFLVMPAYNEEETIESVVRDWYKTIESVTHNFIFVIADSGSVDNTHNILINLQNEFKNLVVLGDTLKQHGPKLIYMYKYSIENGADYIFQTDSDGQTNPDEFLFFWDNRINYDAILGNRVKRGDGIARKIVENIVCFLLNL